MTGSADAYGSRAEAEVTAAGAGLWGIMEQEEGVTAMEAGRLREAEVTTAGAGLWGIMEQELPLREDTKPRPGLPPQ